MMIPGKMIGYYFNDGGRRAAGYKGLNASDCFVRALAIASGKPYKEVYRLVANTFAEHGYPRSGNAVYRTYEARRNAKYWKKRTPYIQVRDIIFEQMGFRKIKLHRGPRPTWSQAYWWYGDCIVKTRRHLAAIKKGMLQDTWDGRLYRSGEYYVERKATSVWVYSP